MADRPLSKGCIVSAFMVTVRDPLLSFCSGFSGPGPENEFVVIRRAARTRTYTHSRPMYRIYQKISLLSAARALDVFVRL